MKLFIFLIYMMTKLSNGDNMSVQVILDTDIGPDYDDVGALTILHTLADREEVEILATVASNKYEGVAAVLSVFNTYFNRSNIPIGVPKGEAVNLRDSQHWSDFIIGRYPHHLENNSDAADSVTVYRKVLSQQSDQSVTIITIGFLTNLANLLASSSDSYSQLTGLQLIKQKVKHLVTMGGGFPTGHEFNIIQDPISAKKVFDVWPTPVIFSGVEIGLKIKTGLPLIHNDSIENSPVKDVFNISMHFDKEDIDGRYSWDETAVLVGVEGYSPYFDITTGRIKLDEQGFNEWDNSTTGMAYLVDKMKSESIESYLNELMMR